jgi:putative two-component system response regulator
MPCILIADDERYQRILLREILSSNPSLTFAEAEDGLQALAEARTQSVDLVLLDIMMPTMDGFAACRAFKADAALQSIPVLLISALGPTQGPKVWKEVGADGFISKPFEEGELQAKVGRTLRVGQK